jgi:hypothetical protein
LIVVTVAAAFSTGSAINSTLFATARLSHIVAKGGELPAKLDHTNKHGAPDRAVVVLGSGAAVLAAIGNLSMLVEAASLAFLFTFATVCGLAFYKKSGLRALTALGCLAATGAILALVYRLATHTPWSLAILAGLIGFAVFFRTVILRHVDLESAKD